MTKKWILLCAIIPSLALLAIATFIWPTPYKYDRFGYYVYKINRYTGETHILYPFVKRGGTSAGWINLTPPPKFSNPILRKYGISDTEEATLLQPPSIPESDLLQRIKANLGETPSTKYGLKEPPPLAPEEKAIADAKAAEEKKIADEIAVKDKKIEDAISAALAAQRIKDGERH